VFFVCEASLTGESLPVEKRPEPSEPGAPIGSRIGAVWMGTSVRSGSATMLVVATARRTELGAIAHRLSLRAPETDFERGLRRFGLLLARVVLVLVLLVFAVNVFAAKPAIDSLLFAIALAIGIAPEMLPAIVAVTLAQGAREMAKHGVIVKRPSAIESFGGMDVLCTDKTGTLTEGTVELDDHLDARGARSEHVLELARANALLQTGLPSPLDQAIIRHAAGAAPRWSKVDEIPYDFERKRMSVVVAAGDAHLMIVKGALSLLLPECSHVREAGAAIPLDETEHGALLARFEAWSAAGMRVLGVATRSLTPREAYHREDERELCLEGFLLFQDPPKQGIVETVQALARAGVAIKMVTGDNRLVAAHVAREVGLEPGEIVTSERLDHLTDEALLVVAERSVVFAEVDPRQKERIVLALRKAGHVVGYMGDGINDAPALHAADVSLSVDGAVDVAREAADFVLLERDLEVLRAGLMRGRVTFANTLKYLYTTQSANFGNMLSMAVASAFLPFLPLTAPQILLNNFLSDLPAMAIATDAVDPEQVARPTRWDLAKLRRFMITFGLISSVFDLTTFGVLLWVAHARAAEFQTGWFVESLLTELAVALVVRTRRAFFRSRPGAWLARASALVAVVAIGLPYAPHASALGLVPLPLWLLGIVIAITIAYVLTVEGAKRLFFAQPARVEAI
ncbi:MAG: magnesium-translocating P-type ATPase, partial [Sandaracinaceae bacterium]|nr:magnesium-translocating P-type ATPase [Sandaracinaceae bacterium]